MVWWRKYLNMEGRKWKLCGWDKVFRIFFLQKLTKASLLQKMMKNMFCLLLVMSSIKYNLNSIKRIENVGCLPLTTKYWIQSGYRINIPCKPLLSVFLPSNTNGQVPESIYALICSHFWHPILLSKVNASNCFTKR